MSDRFLNLGQHTAYVKQAVQDKLIEHQEYIVKYGEDLPEIRISKWPRGK